MKAPTSSGLLTFGDGSSQEWHIGTEVSELKKEIANLKHGWRRGECPNNY